MYEVHIVAVGYSKAMENSEGYTANCSCTLIKGKYNIIVDTMTPWDREYILEKLNQFEITPDEIDFVISTHGHSDHLGNNNLFLHAKHVVGHCFSFKEEYYNDPFTKDPDNCFYIDGRNLYLMATPGHTASCISVLVQTKDGVIAITGDLFERKEDIDNEYMWLCAGSEDMNLQKENRLKIINLADWIVPGHGEIFKVTEQIKTDMNKKNVQ
ncbi:metallo-beta-lactamase domain-containing protein 1 [Rhodnius prolixus]|uniref:Metallo-beta-lactamase domain-containing protein 1 n=2 Tax=Rhodnius TaxID=13248 RepID=T1HLV4_RHOPR